jgi:phage tail-like protein
MAIGDRNDPLVGCNFAVEIEGVVAGGFSEASGLAMEIETQDYREGGVNEYLHRRAGPVKYSSSLVLKKGLMNRGALWDWCWDAFRGKITRRNVSVILMDAAGQEKLRWNFEGAYPVKWSGPDFKAASGEIAVESLELAHKGLAK